MRPLTLPDALRAEYRSRHGCQPPPLHEWVGEAWVETYLTLMGWGTETTPAAPPEEP